MWQWCAYLSGVTLIGVALAAIPSIAIVTSYVGGSAVHGSVENGRYFVNPSHGMPIVEVSEATWRTVYWVERAWPFSIFVPGLAGMFLTMCGKGPDWKPPPAPPAEMPPWMLWVYLVGIGVIVGGTLLFWSVTRIPWATMLVGWILVCVCGAAIVRVYSRFLRQQSPAGHMDDRERDETDDE
jgi:hypothetical protein